MTASMVSWVNRDRDARGLIAFRSDARLNAVAAARAAKMAETGTLSHSVAGNLGSQLTTAGVQWFRWGEDIAYSSASWGTQVAWHVFGMWKKSPSHWPLLMSSSFNYIGVGFARQASTGRTYVAAVMTESVDHTRPSPVWVSSWRSGTTVSWSWRGYDPRLQTHTAGVRSFDIRYRVDNGPWRLNWIGSTAKSITLRNMPRGHCYSLRIQVADWRGNLSRWSSERRICVP